MLILASLLWRRTLFILLVTAVLGLNTFQLTKEIIRIKQKRKIRPYVFTGIKFSGLKDILRDVEYIGYYTDKDLDNLKDALQFSQAQYTLTPVVLDLNNTEHKYILFDCSSPEIALKKIKEIHAVPVRKNQFGIILARRPAFSVKQ